MKITIKKKFPVKKQLLSVFLFFLYKKTKTKKQLKNKKWCTAVGLVFLSPQFRGLQFGLYMRQQVGERHRPVAGAIGHGFLGIEEGPLLHEALQVILGRVTGFQLPQFRQELIPERGLRRRHRPHVPGGAGVRPHDRAREHAGR